MSQPVDLKSIRAGDALIGFSRKQVLGYRAWLRDHGFTVACLYGDLGPEVRRAEAERFRAGKAKVLVATDAIGMGLNLPLRRVVFTATEKYDGCVTRSLEAKEYKQIGGRAGRRGFHEAGEVGVLAGLSDQALVRALHEEFDPLDDVFPLRPTWGVVEKIAEQFSLTKMTEVAITLQRWLPVQDQWSLSNFVDQTSSPWADTVDRLPLSLKMKWDYLGCPVRQTTMEQIEVWVKRHAVGRTIAAPFLDEEMCYASTPEELAAIEAYGHSLTAYRWLARHFPKAYPEYDLATTRHAATQQVIAECLSKNALRRLCRSCGQKLPLTHAFPECERCYQDRQRHRAEQSDWWED